MTIILLLAGLAGPTTEEDLRNRMEERSKSRDHSGARVKAVCTKRRPRKLRQPKRLREFNDYALSRNSAAFVVRRLTIDVVKLLVLVFAFAE